jgi:hypothetical protein
MVFLERIRPFGDRTLQQSQSRPSAISPQRHHRPAQCPQERSWPRCTPAQAETRLGEALKIRHEIAHGVTPRPIVHNAYARELPGLFRKLGDWTDKAIKQCASSSLDISLSW